MYDAVEVAWKMLKVAKDKNIQLSNLQLQKLVYIAHGYFLAWKDKPLIKDPIEAWKYGPVISNIYQVFKVHKSGKIPTDAMDSITINIDDQDVEDCISGILDMYGNERPESLIASTHQPNTPWYKQWEVKGGKNYLFSKMDNDDIKNHYRNLLNDPESVEGL